MPIVEAYFKIAKAWASFIALQYPS
jgi:hypothetical protein